MAEMEYTIDQCKREMVEHLAQLVDLLAEAGDEPTQVQKAFIKGEAALVAAWYRQLKENLKAVGVSLR